MLESTEAAIKEQIKEPIGYDSDECSIWKAQHGSCKGCEFFLGCAKYAGALMVVKLGGLIARKVDILDVIRLADASAVIVSHIAEAQTEEEVHNIATTFLKSLEES